MSEATVERKRARAAGSASGPRSPSCFAWTKRSRSSVSPWARREASSNGMFSEPSPQASPPWTSGQPGGSAWLSAMLLRKQGGVSIRGRVVSPLYPALSEAT